MFLLCLRELKGIKQFWKRKNNNKRKLAMSSWERKKRAQWRRRKREFLLLSVFLAQKKDMREVCWKGFSFRRFFCELLNVKKALLMSATMKMMIILNSSIFDDQIML